ncbi:twin-arginine translocase TatA/TatE family subunit [Hansschlegelia beijingensis]|uniref:Sec-independent protein translocase protein TatA n=1 Tax=Hansschlegelia beijingensis TaxID=1133344 RepID=A0A7W6GHY5_9HYPH|nr:twin-arginine translocase TatA/TatE family subunit [Hansschlegelia beijingensis]MBB3974299.1 sec-independent protein translocase protein TatA [Hansschlegelia beijingensis]
MSLTHWLVVGVLVLLLFGGRGKISDIMGDMAKGIKSFKKGLSEEDEVADGMSQQRGAQTIEHRADPQVRPTVGSVDGRQS